MIIFSKTSTEQISQLRGVFEKLDEAGLHLKLSKCEFFRTQLEYLSHVVSDRGIETSPKKIEAIMEWPRPKTVTQLRSFLGFCNYYRKFIEHFAQIAKSLYKLISGDNAKLKSYVLEWTQEHEDCFRNLKNVCCTTPVLAYADYLKLFILHTDAH